MTTAKPAPTAPAAEQPATITYDVGRELQRAARSIAWRCRTGLYPLAVGAGLWGSAAALHAGDAGALYATGGAVAATVAGLAVGKVRAWLGAQTWRPVWACGSLAVAAGWAGAAAHVGAGMDTPMPTLLIVGGAGVAVPWWWLHRPVPARAVPARLSAPKMPSAIEAAPESPESPGPHPHQRTWKGGAGAKGHLLAGSELIHPEPITDHNGEANGMAWIIDGGPKRHTYPTMRNALDDMKATYDRPYVDSLVHLEQDPEQRKTRGRLIVLDRNPLIQQILWQGPRLEAATGIVPFAVYPDGSGFARYALYVPGWGTPHDLLAGVTGSGKSTGLRLIIGESLCAGSAVMLFDPHGGGSFKDDVVPKVSRAFLDAADIYAGMRGIAAAHAERLKILREVGANRMGPEFGHPIVHTVLDEASSDIALGNRDINRILLAGVQEGRKLWMKYTLAMQRPSSDAFDDNTDAREQLKSGNVILYRVASAESNRMGAAGLDGVAAHTLPKYFDRDMTMPTTGLCYVLTGNGRELVSRTINMTEQAFTAHVPPSRPLDDRTEQAFHRGYTQALNDIARAADGDPAEHTSGGPTAPVIPITAGDKQARQAVLELFHQRGTLRLAEIKDARICSLSHAYRLVEALENEGQVTKTDQRGLYALKTASQAP